MNALILAAGFGTRLLPLTQHLPKPLFTLNRRPMLHHAIGSLEDCGCETILVNSHHLADQIRKFIASQSFTATIKVLHEPEILDTGGAIANALPYLGDAPFFIINADVISSIDLKTVYEYHLKHGRLATLVLHDYTVFNTVRVDEQDCVKGFDDPEHGLAFTGIQVVSPQIQAHFPDKKIFSSIDVYDDLSQKNEVMALVERDLFWSDIGTLNSYTETSLKVMANQTFGHDTLIRADEIKIVPIAGDGSDRQWYRASDQGQSCILCSHGICLPDTQKEKELMAFIRIGNHLRSKKIQVPHIFDYDPVSGVVSLEDLGDTALQDYALNAESRFHIKHMYQTVIEELIDFSHQGQKEFNTDWTCQTPTYSKSLIVENECLYFLNAFINTYSGRNEHPDEFMPEFEYIADQALKTPRLGLMHRDFQSRNIMLKDNIPFFIDFQSARIGPIEYDLASLLIDPYVNLSLNLRTELLKYTMSKLNLTSEGKKRFRHCFTFCCLTRNLQMLGAYGFLTIEKNKSWFEDYIPLALSNLKTITAQIDQNNIPNLSRLVHSL